MTLEVDNAKRKRIAVVGVSILACLLLAGGVAFNMGVFASNFDPSSFLNKQFESDAVSREGNDASYLNDDTKAQGEANVQDKLDDASDSQPENALPDTDNATMNAGSTLAESSTAQVVDSNNANAQGAGQGGNASVNPGGNGTVNPGGNGGQTVDPVSGADADMPPAVVKPDAMAGVSLLELNPVGTAVFTTSDAKDSVDIWQNLSDVSIVAVLYDEKTGAKWTRTLSYGNVDGYTYTITSDSFPITADTKTITVAYYLFGQRYTAEIPCIVGNKLTATAKPDDDFFTHLSVGQEITTDDLKEHLAVSLSGKEIDPALCTVSGFDTATAGKKRVTISYSGLSCMLDYEVLDRCLVFHTPEALQACDERLWGYDNNGFSPSYTTTRFNGCESITQTITASSYDLTNITQQLMGDLYWTQDPKSLSLYYGADPNFDLSYVADADTGVLDDWFVGWATEDPTLLKGAADESWLAGHVVDVLLDSTDMAKIAAKQGSASEVHLYPVFRSQTTIDASSVSVIYNEHSGDWTQYSDTVEDRAPAQIMTSFTGDAVNEGVLSVPRGVTYVSLSPMLSDSVDASVLESVTSISLPSGMMFFDQTVPHYAYPVSLQYVAYDAGIVLPQLSDVSIRGQQAGLGTNNYQTATVDVTHADGSVSQRGVLVCKPDAALALLPMGGIVSTDAVRIPDATGIKELFAASLLGGRAQSIEMPSTLGTVDAKAFAATAVDKLIFNSAVTLGATAFVGETFDDSGMLAGPVVGSIVFNTNEAADVYAMSLDIYYDSSANDLDAFKQADFHVYVPDEDTLVRFYSTWVERLDCYYGAGTTAFLLKLQSNEDVGVLEVDDQGVVYRVSEGAKTLVYAPPSLEGYYELPSDVTAIADSAFAECSKLLGLIVNENDAASLPTLGAYAFGAQDESGYAAPPAVFKVFVSSELAGADAWRDAFKQQYWHTSDQAQAQNADVLVDLVFEDDYESYFVSDGSLYADDTSESGEDTRAILRANDQTKGVFTLYEGTSVVGSFAFAGCEDISLLQGADNLKRIESMAFLDCTRLNIVVLPESLEAVEDCAFVGCSHLEAIAFNGQPSFGQNIFEQAAIPRVYLPAGVAAAGSTFVDSLSALNIVDFKECPYAEGSYSYLTNRGAGFIEETYRCLCTEDGAGHKKTTFAGSDLGSAFWNEATDGLSFYITVGSDITEIGQATFEGQSLLGSVSGADNVQTIADRAFKGCTALTRVELGDWWPECDWIGDEAFDGCASLEMVSFPTDGWMLSSGSDTYHIGRAAFRDCTSLYKTYDPGWGIDPVFAFPDDMNLEIGEEAFKNCTSIPSIDLLNGNVTIGASAFEGCTGITQLLSSQDRRSVDLTVGENAFAGCSLAYISLGGNSVDIAAGAFANMTNLDAVFVSADATIDETAFENAQTRYAVAVKPNALTAEKFDEQTRVDGIIPIADQHSYVGFSFSDDWSDDREITCAGDNLSFLNVSDFYSGAYTIGDAVFKDNENLVSVSLGGGTWNTISVKAIGDEAFMGCVNLLDTGLQTDTAVASIGASAYEGCTSITEVSIPYMTGSIGDRAFKGCTSLQTVYHYCALDWDGSYLTPCVLGASAFENCTSLTLYDMSSFVTEVKEDCFKGCDNLQLLMYWIGDASTFGLPVLHDSIFGVAGASSPLPDTCTLTVGFDSGVGTSVTQEQLEAMFTNENGWLQYKDSYSFDESAFSVEGYSLDALSLDESSDASEGGLPESPDAPDAAEVKADVGEAPLEGASADEAPSDNALAGKTEDEGDGDALAPAEEDEL